MVKFFAAFTLTTVLLCGFTYVNTTPSIAIDKPSVPIDIDFKGENKLPPYKVPAHSCIVNVIEGDEQLLNNTLTNCLEKRNWLMIRGGTI